MKEARENGVADLRVTVEGKSLEVEFCAAMDDLVGFLGEPRTRAQREVLVKVEERLKQFERLFVLAADSGCRLRRADLDLPWKPKAGEPGGAHAHGHGHDPAHHGHDGHGHAHHHEGHAHDDHHDHHDHHDHDEPEDPVPADVHALYRLDCTNSRALAVMEVRVFNSFPRIEKVRARMEKPEGETTVVLDRERQVLQMKDGG